MERVFRKTEERIVTINQVQSFEDLERFLREFTNFGGDPVPYDFMGAYNLFLAVLDNLIHNHIDADIEDLKETPPTLTEPQRAFINQLFALDENGSENDE